MTTLNLANPTKSSIAFAIQSFPDGQQDIRLTLDPEMAKWGRVEILSRFNSFKDLEVIIAAKAALQRAGISDVSLFIPYLLGARSERKFVDGGTSYLVDVVAPILNAQNFSQIRCMDAHSDVALAAINGLISEPNTRFVMWALQQIEGNLPLTLSKSVVVSPDAGAAKKIYNLLGTLFPTQAALDAAKVQIIFASKHRDLATGKILGSDVPVPADSWGRNFIIVDDICDGGRTFTEIAKALRGEPKFGDAKVYLISTHGIFSDGYSELNKNFDGIFTTDSVQVIGDTYFDGYHDKPTGVKQYPLFG
jgi:ribose-phosphate pyrophosphokinase